MLKWFIVVICLILFLIPSPVLADTSGTVTITATGLVVAAPGGFTVWYISDYEVGISWTKPSGAANTMVRAKYGSPPTSITDGYLVYYGADELASDTGVSLDETATEVYYRAWSETALGAWGPLWAEGQMEGIGMTLIALIILGLGFTIASYIFRKNEASWAAAGAWFVLGIYSFTKSDSGNPAQITDIYMAMFWLG